MAKGWRVFWGIIISVLVIGLVLFILSYRLLTNSLPHTNGSDSLVGLKRPVHVYRDQYGVPHIFAENEADLFMAAGYVTAQDRLWQMDFSRRVACGRLAEIFGQDMIKEDTFLRRWGFNRIASTIADTLSSESRQALESYTAGVNAFIESHLDNLPVEFSLLRFKPEKWRIEDSIAYARLMAWKLSFSWYVDITLQKLVERLGEQKAREVFPDFPADAPVIISAKERPFWTGAAEFLKSGLEVQNLLGIKGIHLGSNSWVVSGEKSLCGKPLLANDPHLELTTPSVWYEMHLSGGGINVAGVTLPGIPGVVIGHNENIAWGLTNGMVDDVDFYVEKTNPEDSSQYLQDWKWVDFDTVEEEIRVKNQKPINLKIRFTGNGPVISDFHPLLKDSNEVVSMRWVGQQPSDEFLAYLKIQKAKNWQEFSEALRHFKTPAQNFVFASKNGDIGYYLGGAIPIRKFSTGVLPHAGWLERGKWVGEVPFEKKPHILNPPENYLVTANNKIVDDRYPFYISNLWEPPSRAERIHQLLSAKARFTLDDFKSMQLDVASAHAQKLLPVVLAVVASRLDSVSHDSLATLYHFVKDWDGEETEQSIAASIFNAFFVKVTENTLKDEMGDELYESYIHLSNVPYRVMTKLLQAPESEWFDDVITPETETKQTIIVRSFLDSGNMLRKMAGENFGNWTWGKVHTLTMSHTLGVAKPLERIFDIGPFARGGSNTTINNAEYRFYEPFEAILGASTRQLVDLCDIAHSLSVIPTGQSGQRMSSHYKDQTRLWLKGEYHPMVMDRIEIAETSRQHLTLMPDTNLN